MNMYERSESIKEWRKQGLTYDEIGKKLGVSRQRAFQIASVTKTRKVYVKPENCVYPKLRTWMMENNVSINGLARLIYGRAYPEETTRISNALKGKNCTKKTIDNILRATNLTYEYAFNEGGETE